MKNELTLNGDKKDGQIQSVHSSFKLLELTLNDDSNLFNTSIPVQVTCGFTVHGTTTLHSNHMTHFFKSIRSLVLESFQIAPESTNFFDATASYKIKKADLNAVDKFEVDKLHTTLAIKSDSIEVSIEFKFSVMGFKLIQTIKDLKNYLRR